jgi:hypothetical protein
LTVTSHASACGPKGKNVGAAGELRSDISAGSRGSREDEAAIGPNPSGVSRRSIRAKLYVAGIPVGRRDDYRKAGSGGGVVGAHGCWARIPHGCAHGGGVGGGSEACGGARMDGR